MHIPSQGKKIKHYAVILVIRTAFKIRNCLSNLSRISVFFLNFCRTAKVLSSHLRLTMQKSVKWVFHLGVLFIALDYVFRKQDTVWSMFWRWYMNFKFPIVGINYGFKRELSIWNCFFDCCFVFFVRKNLAIWFF